MQFKLLLSALLILMLIAGNGLTAPATNKELYLRDADSAPDSEKVDVTPLNTITIPSHNLQSGGNSLKESTKSSPLPKPSIMENHQEKRKNNPLPDVFDRSHIYTIENKDCIYATNDIINIPHMFKNKPIIKIYQYPQLR